jgi:hypothetical protein
MNEVMNIIQNQNKANDGDVIGASSNTFALF